MPSDGAIVSPVTGNIEDTVTLNFSEAGLYTITVEVMSAAVETVIYTEEFEVTAIEAPLTSAPNPPARSADDVSVQSDLISQLFFFIYI